MTNLILFENKMKEILTLCIGQAGVQLGDGCAKLFAEEHGIDADG